MTTWSKTPPSEPGYCWARRVDPKGVWARSKPLVVVETEYAQYWAESQRIDGDRVEFGPRIPSPEAIEAAKDALLEAFPHLPDSAVERCRQALAKLEGRS